MADETEDIARKLAAESIGRGEPVAWFETLYGQAEGDPSVIPWADLTINPSLAGWLETNRVNGAGKTALVVGCGLGDDAESLAALGFRVAAFDISPTCIDWCRQRFPDSRVVYRVADLFNAPLRWHQAFDLVIEIYTLQVLPERVRTVAMHTIGEFVAAGGTLLVVARGRDVADDSGNMPWPLIRSELDSFSRAESRELWFEFLSLPTMSMGVYRVPAGTCDRENHKPHDRDEIYVGTSGKGRLTVGEKEFDSKRMTDAPSPAGNDSRLCSDQFPRSSKYHPDWTIANSMSGCATLWLTEWLTAKLELKPGMRVLDLGCGRAISSIFLAREFDLQVWATDLWIGATENRQRIRDCDESNRVFPIHADARSLPFAAEFFDAIVCVDAFSYFGTDDLYLNYLTQFVKPTGQIGIAGAGLTHEFESVPDHLRPMWSEDFWCLHSADWWRSHWGRTGLVDVEVADSMPDGWKHWLEWQQAAHPENTSEIETVAADAGANLACIRAIARRRKGAALVDYCWPDTLRSFPGEYKRAMDQQVDDFVLTLQSAVGDHRRGAGRNALIPFPYFLPDDQIRRAGFVFQRDERNPLGRAGTLPQQNEPGDFARAVVRRCCQIRRLNDLPLLQQRTDELDRMSAQRQTVAFVVGDDFFLSRHHRQVHRRFFIDGFSEQRQRLLFRQRFPERFAPPDVQRPECISLRQLFEHRVRQPGPPGEVVERREAGDRPLLKNPLDVCL
eukprot:g26656.t1